MPFINGRYHVNPIMGEALEAAREADPRSSRCSSGRRAIPAIHPATPLAKIADPDDPASARPRARADPSRRDRRHPARASNTGHATRGFVARVHRAPGVSAASPAPAPETQVFADHGDLANFLRDALSPTP